MFKKIVFSLAVIGSFSFVTIDKAFAEPVDSIVVNELTSAESQDFVELYARKDINLGEYLLHYSKSTTGNYTVILPEVELSAGSYYVVGKVAESDYDEVNINLVQSGERLVWLEKKEGDGLKIGQIKYPTTLKSGESYQRVCDEKFEKTSQPSPGKVNISTTQCDSGDTEDPEEDPITPVDPDDPVEPSEPQYCDKLKLSEISTNEQWIELYNNSAKNIKPENLKGCKLGVQRGEKKNGVVNYYYQNLADLVTQGNIAAYSFWVVDIANSSLTLAKNVNDRSIIVTDSETEFDEILYSKQKTGTSFAKFANDSWKVTYAPTKAADNVFQKWQTCQPGTHINEATGNCVKDKEAPAECADGYFRNPATGRCKKKSSDKKELSECADGYYRNPLTNRCKKNSSAADKALAECPAGQYRNPATNRCKKYSTKEDLAPCAEGWERNPETNRCRKIVQKEEAKYALEPNIKSESDESWRLVGSAGLAFIGGLTTWQFRPELAHFGRKIFGFIKRDKK